MLTTRLSSVITGCGSKETTCSRKSISGQAVDERDQDRDARVERPLVAAEPLDEAGLGLRDDLDGPPERQHNERRNGEQNDERDHGNSPLLIDERGCAVDLDDFDPRTGLVDIALHV